MDGRNDKDEEEVDEAKDDDDDDEQMTDKGDAGKRLSVAAAAESAKMSFGWL